MNLICYKLRKCGSEFDSSGIGGGIPGFNPHPQALLPAGPDVRAPGVRRSASLSNEAGLGSLRV